MKWVYDDPSSRYFETHENDSISRSISIATGISYDRVQAMLDEYIKRECLDDKYVSNSRLKLRKEVAPKFLKDLGYSWICKMQFSGGCKFHLKDGELPVEFKNVNVRRYDLKREFTDITKDVRWKNLIGKGKTMKEVGFKLK